MTITKNNILLTAIVWAATIYFSIQFCFLATEKNRIRLLYELQIEKNINNKLQQDIIDISTKIRFLDWYYKKVEDKLNKKTKEESNVLPINESIIKPKSQKIHGGFHAISKRTGK
jgi:hypothetical protein